MPKYFLNSAITVLIILLLQPLTGHVGQATEINKSAIDATDLPTLIASKSSLDIPSLDILRRDDPGGVWIIYDDSMGANYWEDEESWSRVVFTSADEFTLYGTSIQILNYNDNDGTIKVQIYSEDQNSGDLSDMLYEWETDDLPSEEWMWFEIDEDERPTFEADENFSIIIGPAPGGDPWNNGGGWSALGDRRPVEGRSYNYSGDEPAEDFDDWSEINHSDLMIRANGNYAGDFTDLKLIEVYNHLEAESRRWMVTEGDSVNFYAILANIGSTVENFEVIFRLTDADNQNVFEISTDYEELQAGDTTIVECTVVWVPESPYGLYRLTVTAEIEDDVTMFNNSIGLDQIVYHPQEAADTWLGYTVGDSGGLWAFDNNPAGGWGAMFYHPGGNDPMYLTEVRTMTFGFSVGEPVDEIEYRAYIYDLEEESFNLTWQHSKPIQEEILAWEKVELDEDEYIRISDDQALLVTWMQGEGLRLRRDMNPPQAAKNLEMPAAIWQTINDGDDWTVSNELDCAIQVRMMNIDYLPSDFALLTPVNNDIIESEELVFSWEQSVDLDANPDTDTLLYNLYLSTADDTVMFRTDTTYIVLDLLESGIQYESGTEFYWYVDAISNGDTTKCDRNFSFTYVVNSAGSVLTTIPDEFEIKTVYPNPFNAAVEITYSLNRNGNTTISVYDFNGRLMTRLDYHKQTVGYHTVAISAVSWPSGTYMASITSGNDTRSAKLITIK